MSMNNVKRQYAFLYLSLLIFATSGYSQSTSGSEPIILSDSIMAQRYNFNRYLFYPENARNKEIQGTVILTFDVDSTCAVVNRKVVVGIGFGCDQAALYALDKVAKEMKREYKLYKSFSGTLPSKFILVD